MIHLVYYVVIFLNYSVTKNGVSDTLSLREIVLRQKLDVNKHCATNGEPLEYGKYEAHEDPDTISTS